MPQLLTLNSRAESRLSLGERTSSCETKSDDEARPVIAPGYLVRAWPFLAVGLAKWTIGWWWFRPSGLVDTLAFAGVMLAILALVAVAQYLCKLPGRSRSYDERRFRLPTTPLIDESA